MAYSNGTHFIQASLYYTLYDFTRRAKARWDDAVYLYIVKSCLRFKCCIYAQPPGGEQGLSVFPQKTNVIFRPLSIFHLFVIDYFSDARIEEALVHEINFKKVLKCSRHVLCSPLHYTCHYAYGRRNVYFGWRVDTEATKRREVSTDIISVWHFSTLKVNEDILNIYNVQQQDWAAEFL